MESEMPSDLDEGTDWGKGVPMARGQPTHYEPLDENKDDRVQVLVVGQPKYRRTRAGQVLSFEGEFEFDKKKHRAEFTVWEDKLDLVREDLSRGDIVVGLLKNAKEYKGKAQFTLEPVLEDDVKTESPPQNDGAPQVEEKTEPPRNVGEEYETLYSTSPISWRTPVNYQQISKIVETSFANAFKCICGLVEAKMVEKQLPASDFPLGEIVTASQALGATISIACTNGVVTISRERKARREDRPPSLDSRDIADQVAKISERLKMDRMAPMGQEENEND